MAASDNTKLGDYCKDLESLGTSLVFPRSEPIFVRVDGRAFHTFTKNLDKPYDLTMMACMQDTAVELVQEFQPALAFWQSDEITLLWMPDPTGRREYPFAGKAHKLMSVIAGMASSVFMAQTIRRLPALAASYPHFDGRAFSVPDAHDAMQVLRWRHKDAVRNSVLGYAHSLFGHRAILNKKVPELLQMIAAAGHDFEAAPMIWRHGEFLRRQVFHEPLETEFWERIPEAHRPAEQPVVERSRVVSLTTQEGSKTLAAVYDLLGLRRPCDTEIAF